MTRSDIHSCVREGRLDDALRYALNQLQLCPEALWARQDIARVYEALCKQDSLNGDIESFSSHFQQLADLNILKDDLRLSESLCWIFRQLLHKCSERLNAQEKNAFAQRFFHLACQLAKPRPSTSYAVLCKEFYQLRIDWPGFLDFMDWFGWDNFRPEDYEREVLPDGKRKPISLAEGCHIAYAKLLLQTNDNDRIQGFIPRLEAINEQHPEMMYPGYYLGKLMIAQGGNQQETMLQTVLPFVRRKSGEFWAWQLLAEIMQSDATMHKACLLRAVSCKSEDNYLVSVLYRLSSLLIAERDYAGARHLLQRYVAAREANQSRLPNDVYHWTSEAWYQDENLTPQHSPSLSSDYLSLTDALLYRDQPEIPLYVTYVNSERRVAAAIYGMQQRGEFRLPRNLRKLQQGTLLMGRLNQVDTHGDKLSFYTLRKIQLKELPDAPFLRHVQGKVTSNSAQTAHFVKFGREFAFLSPNLLQGQSLAVGSDVSALILCDYQKAKQCWSWRCIEVQAQ